VAGAERLRYDRCHPCISRGLLEVEMSKGTSMKKEKKKPKKKA
jgi:hypothetical protein